MAAHHSSLSLRIDSGDCKIMLLSSSCKGNYPLLYSISVAELGFEK